MAVVCVIGPTVFDIGHTVFENKDSPFPLRANGIIAQTADKREHRINIQLQISVSAILLINLGCHNRMPRAKVASTMQIYFFAILEARSLRSGLLHGLVLVRLLFLTCKRPPSHCVLTWYRECSNVSLSSYKDTSYV